MAEGPFGIRRPFVEESESPLFLLTEYDRDFQEREDVRREIQGVIVEIGEMGVGINDVEIVNIVSPESGILVTIELLVTNMGIQIIDDIRGGLRTIRGYRNLTVSTVGAKDLEKFR